MVGPSGPTVLKIAGMANNTDIVPAKAVSEATMAVPVKILNLVSVITELVSGGMNGLLGANVAPHVKKDLSIVIDSVSEVQLGKNSVRVQ